VAGAGERAPLTGSSTLFFSKLIATKGAFHNDTPKVVSIRFRMNPTKKAKGKMNRAIASAVFTPLSFSITANWAMHGTKRVRVTAATTSGIPESTPELCRSYNPAAPKSRRKKP